MTSMTPARAGRARKGLGSPAAGRFAGLEDAWSDYRPALTDSLEADPRWESTDHYLYQVHNLDRLDEIAAVAQRADNDVAAELSRIWCETGPRTPSTRRLN